MWALPQISDVPLHVDVRHAFDNAGTNSEFALLCGVVLASAHDAHAHDLADGFLVEGPVSEVTSEEGLRQLGHDLFPWLQKQE